MSESIAFDRAADYYDRTRALSLEAVRQMVEVLAAELAGRGTCLEVGVGTGRIALPLHRAGVAMAGADLSLPMLRKLVENAGGHALFPVAAGDALALPFRDGVFGASMVVHVLHLVPRWRDVLAEMVRVMRPGGVVLANLGGGMGTYGEIGARFQEILGAVAERVGLTERSELDEAMSSFGARPRLLAPITHRVTVQPETVISQYEGGLFSWTWSVPEQAMREAAVAVRAWWAERYGDLTAPVVTESDLVWLAYDVP